MSTFSMFPPGIAIKCNTSEIYHSGIKLDDAGGAKSHDYLLISSPRKVKPSAPRRAAA